MLVHEWPECKGRKSQYTSNDIQIAKETNRFFNPVDRLDRFSVSVQKLDEWNQKRGCNLNEKSPFDDAMKKEPHPTAVLVDRIQTSITKQMQNDLTTQSNLMDNTILCTEEKVPADLEKKCKNFVDTLMPELQKRLSHMRALKSIADNNEKPLAHDKPFTTELYQTMWPSIWKKDSATKLSPLTEDEQKIRTEYTGKNVYPDTAKSGYYSLISTTPVLLFFDKNVTKQNLNQAFKKLKQQNAFDQGELLKEPPQDLLMMVDYTRKAIADLPDTQKGDACLAVREIYQNLHTQYEKFPMYAAAVGGALSLTPSPINLKIWGKTFKVLEGQMTKFGLTATAVTGSISYQSLQKYNRGARLCSTQAITDDQWNSKICATESLDRVYDNLQTGAVMTTGMGAFSTVRIIKGIISSAK